MATNLTQDHEYGRFVNVFKQFQERLAELNGVEPDLVRPTNGATSALGAVLSATRINDANKNRPSTALVASLEYFDVFCMLAMYGFDMATVKNEGILYPTEEVIRKLETKPSVLYLSVPNNPTGALLPKEELEEILKCADETRIIIDRSLVHPDEYCSGSELHKKYADKDIVVVDSFSKSLGIVRDRVGYFFGLQSTTINSIHPYAHAPHLQAMAHVMGLLEDTSIITEIIHKQRTSDAILRARNWKQGMQYHPSLSNFALLELEPMSGEECRIKLEDKGYLVKSGNQLHIPDRYIRIDMGQPESLEGFFNALNQVV